MSISILYKYEEDSPQLGEEEADRQILYDLSVDRAMMTVCMDTIKREKFLGVLARTLNSVDAVVYRQQILAEFIEHPVFLDEMKGLFTKYKNIKTRWDEERSKSFTMKRLTVEKNDELYANLVSLQLTGRYAKVILSYIRSIYDLMNNYTVTSEGLSRIRNYCADIIRSESYGEMEKLADKCESRFDNRAYQDMLIEFDSDMKLKVCSFASVNEFREILEKKKNGLFSFGKKEAAEIKYEDAVDVNTMNIDELTELSIIACRGLDQILTRIMKTMYNELYGIVAELDFYELAVMYCDRMRDRGADMCFPTIREADANVLYCENLKDVMLVCESINPSSIVPNDVTIDGKIEGMLIRGENNSGKTVYLRSVGTALVFAQAGLMIAAKNAEISIRSNIFTHFASAEETGGTASAGRFEQEVKVFSEIINKFTPNSLILLNETFQTTSYDEGAEGIYHILNHIRSLGGGFIFVTHLHHLFELYSEDSQICFRRTTSGNETKYKIIEI